MWCISAYEYVVGEAKMTKIFAVYLQAAVFPHQSTYMVSSADENSLGDMISHCLTPLLMLILLLSRRFPLRVLCTHLLSPVLEARSVLLEFVLSRMLSRSRRMRCKMGYYILCTSPSVGLRLGCGLSLSICF